ILNAIPLPALKITVYFKDTPDGKGGTIKAKTVQIEFTFTPAKDFFGNKIEGFELSYDPDPKKRLLKRLSFKVKGTFPVLGGQTDPSWDPTAPSDAPAVPGQGSKLIDIQLVAAGQRVKVDIPDNATVEDAVAKIAALVPADGSDPDNLPKFDASRGWLVATHM